MTSWIEYPDLPPLPNEDSDSEHEFFDDAPPPPDMTTPGSIWTKSTITSDEKPKSIKVDNIRQLEGRENYETWASAMKLVWRAMKCLDIVVHGATPPTDVSPEEKAVYDSLCDLAAATYIQVVSSDILEKISEL